MKIPAYQWFDFSVDSDNRKKWVASLGGFYERGVNGSESISLRLNLNWKPDSRISLSLSPSYNTADERTQWVTAVKDEAMAATFGTRYIFARLEQKTVSLSLRLNWIFSPKISLQAYIQPFLSVGRYSDFGELTQAKGDGLRVYGGEDSSLLDLGGRYQVDPDSLGPHSPFVFNNLDFNVKSLRGTVVLRWEYRLGSSFYFVWTQNRSDTADAGDFRLGRDLGNLFSSPGDNIFMIKLSHSFNL